MPKVTEEHRAARREQILQAALRCVAREGFHKTTMAAVIGEAGLSAGAVYGYFKSKSEIIRGLADMVLGEVAHQLDDLTHRDEPVAPADAVELLLRYVETMASRDGADYTVVGVQVWAEALRDPEIHRIARNRMGLLRSALVGVLRRAQVDGSLAADADPDRVARMVFSILPGYVVQRLILGDVDPETHMEGFRDLVRGPSN